jgi:hypothetical protein
VSPLIKYAAPIETAIEKFRWSFAEHLHEGRANGVTYRRLAEIEGIHRATASRYARAYAWAAKRYGWDDDLAPSCNQVRLTCMVCEGRFVASRADARYCSNACRQDAYRKRKLGAVA